MTKNTYFSLIIIALTIYSIRLMPFLFLRKPITNRWFKSFLHYVPYVTLSVMTFPAIIECTQSQWSGIAALVIGVIMSWFGAGLFPVACASCIVVFVSELFLVQGGF